MTDKSQTSPTVLNPLSPYIPNSPYYSLAKASTHIAWPHTSGHLHCHYTKDFHRSDLFADSAWLRLISKLIEGSSHVEHLLCRLAFHVIAFYLSSARFILRWRSVPDIIRRRRKQTTTNICEKYFHMQIHGRAKKLRTVCCHSSVKNANEFVWENPCLQHHISLAVNELGHSNYWGCSSPDQTWSSERGKPKLQHTLCSSDSEWVILQKTLSFICKTELSIPGSQLQPFPGFD